MPETAPVVMLCSLSAINVPTRLNVHTCNQCYCSCPGLDIGLVGPVARGASRFENLLAPQKTYWPGGPVDLKTYWPPKKLTGPQNQTCATKN